MAEEKKKTEKKTVKKGTAAKSTDKKSTQKHARKRTHLVHNVSEQQVLDSMDRKLVEGTKAVKEANTMAIQGAEQSKALQKSRIMDWIYAALAVLIGSAATVSILIPNGLTIGGFSGIARIVQYYTNWNYSLVYYAFCMVILLIVWLALGVKELRKIVIMSIAYPVVMFLFEINNVVLLKSDDLLLVSVFCGVTLGISGGLTFKAGFSSGGADSLAKVLKYKYMPHLGINDITFVLNGLVVLASAFVFGVNIALYANIITYIQMRVGEAIMFGLAGQIVELDIIPSNPKAVTEYINSELGRGVTSQEIKGGYTGEKREQLKVLCSPRESFLIKRYLAHHDPKSFVSVTSVKSVWGTGRGFSNIQKIDD